MVPVCPSHPAVPQPTSGDSRIANQHGLDGEGMAEPHGYSYNPGHVFGNHASVLPVPEGVQTKGKNMQYLRAEKNADALVVHFLDKKIHAEFVIGGLGEKLYAVADQADCLKLVLSSPASISSPLPCWASSSC